MADDDGNTRAPCPMCGGSGKIRLPVPDTSKAKLFVGSDGMASSLAPATGETEVIACPACKLGPHPRRVSED